MTMTIALTVDGCSYSADAPLGTTLRQYLEMVDYPLQPGRLMSDGRRALSLDLELAYRFRDAQLSSVVPDEMLLETPALLSHDLLVTADKA